MTIKWLRVVIFVFFILGAVLMGASRSLAQTDTAANGDDYAADEKAREEQAQQALDQIHHLEAKIQDNAKRLDALEKSINQLDTADAPAQPVETNTADLQSPEPKVSEQESSLPQVPVKEAPAPLVVPVEPVIVLPKPSIYYAPSLPMPKVHAFELSQEDFYSSFKENGDPNSYIGHDVKKSGAYYGIYGEYNFRPLEAENLPINVFHMDVHGDYGIEDYDFLGEGKIKSVNAYIVEPRVWVGKDINFGSSNSLTPYVGFGYRWNYEDLTKKFSDALKEDGGSNIQTQYFYIPIGVRLSVRPVEGWRIAANSEYDYLAWGRITNYSASFSSGTHLLSVPEFNNTLRHGYGIRGSVKITKEGDTVNYFIEPYVQFWEINASNTVTATAHDNGVAFRVDNREAKSRTLETGARVGVEF